MIACNLLSFLFGISICFAAGTAAHEAIIDGQLARYNEFPYQVTMRIHGVHDGREILKFCSGGLISTNFVLTAAHCLHPYDIMTHIVVSAQTLDKLNEKPPAVTEVVERMFWSKKFNADKFLSPGDVAVLVLKNSLNVPKQQNWKLLLPDNVSNTYLNQTAEIAGYGAHSLGGPFKYISDNKLRFAKAKVILCDEKIRTQVPQQVLCARVKAHGQSRPLGVCQGDSGSPLVDNGIVIGIFSSCPSSCHEENYHSFYTRVSHYANDIRNIMNNIYTESMYTRELL